MKKKNREINIFSMSALDLFASAMGAFLLIAVIALPYYLKVDKDLIKQVKVIKKKLQQIETQNKQQKEKIKKLEQEKKKVEEENQKLQKKLSETFCVINMKWESNNKQDIDLHVIDPDGKEYFYKKPSYPGETAFLTVDSKGVKKGAEVWMEKKLKTGIYKIYYVYYSGTAPVKAKGVVFTKSFTKELPEKTFSQPNTKRKIFIATIKVDENGNAELELE